MCSKTSFLLQKKNIDIKEPLQQSTIWITQQFVWVNFLQMITKESSIGTNPKDFCEKIHQSCQIWRIFFFEITIFRQ
jgi:hypothetical protein